MTGPVFSLRELSTDLKNTDYHFQNLGKTTGFCSKILCKHCICDNTIYIWEYFFIFPGFFFLFLSFIVSEINFIFCSETRILKEYVVQNPDCFRLIVSKQHDLSDRSSRSQMFFKTGGLKNFTIFTRKHQCWSLFFINFPQSSLLKRDSNTGIFLWILQNF